jgi:hypothetical protein
MQKRGPQLSVVALCSFSTRAISAEHEATISYCNCVTEWILLPQFGLTSRSPGRILLLEVEKYPMRLSPSHALASALLMTAMTPLFAVPRPHRGPTSPKATRGHSVRASVHTTSAPAGIATARATQIQTALIKNGYMTGEPSGVWDATSQAAMVKLQGENGWQTKLVPDSRALIKLGLGPGSTPALENTEASAVGGDLHTSVGNQ